ncbi:UDP-N-acetylmuramoyl-tripeptide--D-alanyl-D-alanine ligase [Patescibacteria group bacterium]|nr:UDP-N-acetylmuramoyl-tripeptide--D-alanyl-D-alanine ligase [Patescibacteria group bacterium]
MDIFTLTKILLWLIVNARRQLLFTHCFQVKEYRLDRLFFFAKSPEGTTRLELLQLTLKLIVLFSPYPQLIFILLTYELIQTTNNFLSHQLKRPQLSIRGKNFLLTSITFLIIATFLLYRTPHSQSFLHLDLISYLIPFLALAWTQLKVNQVLKEETHQAKKRLNKFEPQVIGITGSYAKSSTKHLLQSILSSHFNSLATPASHNTPFGIIRTINSSLSKNTDYFIAEMGAYKRGEIKTLTQITPPHIALITGITPQHLELFGSLENLLQTKYEIAKNLNPKEPLFINTSHPSTKPLIKLAKKQGKFLLTYALNKKADYTTKITSQLLTQTKFSFITSQGTHPYVTNIVLPHLIENITGALAVAHYLKIPTTKIKKSVKNIQTNTFSLSTKKLNSKITILDDSYNSNPQGFTSAVKHLLKHPGFTIIITPGIIELGPKSNQIHQKLGKQLQKTDLILLTNPQFALNLKKGLGKHSHKLQIINSKNIKKHFTHIKKPIIILLEGRLPTSIKKFIFNLK